MEKVIKAEPDYHLRLIVMYQNGHTGYSTFTSREWPLAADRFVQEMGDFEVIEARLILHRIGSDGINEDVAVQEYYR